MAISWVTALKVIPWGEVLEATPQLVKGARRLFARSGATEAETEAAPAGVETQEQQLQRLREELAALAAEQQSTAELLTALTEQHSRVVEAIEILRVRTRMLLVTSVGLGLAVLALFLRGLA